MRLTDMGTTCKPNELHGHATPLEANLCCIERLRAENARLRALLEHLRDELRLRLSSAVPPEPEWFERRIHRIDMAIK